MEYSMLRLFYGLLLLLLLSGFGVQAQVLASADGLGARPGRNVEAAAARSVKPDSIYVNPQVLPSFTGGLPALVAYIAKNMHYPEQAERQHAGGKVYVAFVVNASGRVQDVQVVRGVGASLDDEARRLVWLMPPWQPGKQQGQPVRTACTIPIVFQP